MSLCSMGGLVVKQMLYNARTENLDDFIKNTVGVVCFTQQFCFLQLWRKMTEKIVFINVHYYLLTMYTQDFTLLSGVL